MSIFTRRVPDVSDSALMLTMCALQMFVLLLLLLLFLAHQHKACAKDIKHMKQRIATSWLVVNVF